MKKVLLLLVSVFLFSQSVLAALPPKDACVAVMDFGTRPGASTSEINIHNAEYTSSEYVINRFVNQNCFTVKEKDVVMPRLKEQNLKTTGLIDPDTAKRIGEMLGVRYIIYGNVANVSVSNTGTEILYNIGGGVNVCTVKAHMVGRLMDVQTGDILMAARGDGQSKSSFVKVRAGGNLLNAHVLTIGTVKVTMDSVHNAIQKAAEQMVDSMVSTVTGLSLQGKGGKKLDREKHNKNENSQKKESKK